MISYRKPRAAFLAASGCSSFFQNAFHRHQMQVCRPQQRRRLVCSASIEQRHKAVLVREVLEYLPENVRSFVDCTVGAGGHARAVLAAHPEIERYIGIDKDDVALELARQLPSPPVEVVQGDFRQMKQMLQRVDLHAVDAVLMDVGVSSMQLDDGERGFSFMRDGRLDMRMSGRGISAEDIVNGVREEELSRMIYEYGEERSARRIARAIVDERQRMRITTTTQLAEIIAKTLGWRRKGFHPATLTFQALRIAVNGELEALEHGLTAGVNLLGTGGVLAVICFHSLEDRIAKRSLREMAQQGVVKILTKKPVMAKDDERRENVRSRSAKLRVVQRL